MIYTKQKIANVVFQRTTGRATAYDLTSTTLMPVAVFNEQYDMLVEAAMQKHSWTWTKRVQEIPSDDFEETDGEYCFKFRVPEHLDSLKGVYDDEDCRYAIPYDMHDGYIWVNCLSKKHPRAFIKYISTPYEGIMPSYFVNWLCWFLADNMVMEISGDTDRLKIIETQEPRALRVALAADAKQRGATAIPTDGIISARN